MPLKARSAAAPPALIDLVLRNGRILRLPESVPPGRAAALADALEGLADDCASGWRAGLAGERPHRHAEGLRRLGAAGAGNAQAQSAQWPSVRVPWPARRTDQGALARWPGHVPVCQATGARPLCLAVHRQQTWTGR